LPTTVFVQLDQGVDDASARLLVEARSLALLVPALPMDPHPSRVTSAGARPSAQ
jgi:hypothetical protein